MGYSILNSETGEFDYVRSDQSTAEHQLIDEETGEPTIDEKLKVRYVKHKRFQIPKNYLRGTMCEEFEKEITGDYSDQKALMPYGVQEKPKEIIKKQYELDDYINMEGVKQEIILGYCKETYRLLLLPSFVFFNCYWALLIFLVEMFLHFWVHFKNSLNTNKSVYYRSPMHELTSHFCATCRSESGDELRILDMLNMQMRKARDSETLKNVTKVIS